MSTHINSTDFISGTPFNDEVDGITITIWLKWDPCHPGDSGHLPLAEFKSDTCMTIAEAIKIANDVRESFSNVYSGCAEHEHIEWEIQEYLNDDESLCIKHNII